MEGLTIHVIVLPRNALQRPAAQAGDLPGLENADLTDSCSGNLQRPSAGSSAVHQRLSKPNPSEVKAGPSLLSISRIPK